MSSEPQPNVERRRVVFHGHVQGVFFRATTAELSRQFRVAGYVRNRSDGAVELEAEGAPDQIDGLLAEVRRHYEAHITDIETAAIPVRGDESSFVIRY